MNDNKNEGNFRLFFENFDVSILDVVADSDKNDQILENYKIICQASNCYNPDFEAMELHHVCTREGGLGSYVVEEFDVLELVDLMQTAGSWALIGWLGCFG